MLRIHQADRRLVARLVRPHQPGAVSWKHVRRKVGRRREFLGTGRFRLVMHKLIAEALKPTKPLEEFSPGVKPWRGDQPCHDDPLRNRI
jgi:hypothetical protein